MQGTPLINVLVLKPDAGFIFLKVIALHGMCLWVCVDVCDICVDVAVWLCQATSCKALI